MKIKKQIIPIDSLGLVKECTLKAWLGQNGRYFIEEQDARWDACTHTYCECGALTEKLYTHCESCREDRAWERFLLLEQVEWDRKTPLYSEVHDEYFWDEEHLLDYLSDNECSAVELRLKLCRPAKQPQLDLGDQLDDYLGDDEFPSIPQNVIDAVDKLNKELESLPKRWVPGRKRIKLPIN